MNLVRREKIRQFVEAQGVASLQQLLKLCPGISLMTIHRDLKYLESQGFLVKVRGGARCVVDHSGEPAFAVREVLEQSAKRTIADKAVPLLLDSGSVFIDAGTTMMAFARQIPDIHANILTTGPNIALELATRPLLTISLCGGVLNKNNLTLSGTAALDYLGGINIDTAFIVPSGYGSQTGFTCGMEAEARIKKMIIKKARTRIIMVDSSKFERILPYTFAALSDFDYMITDLNPHELPANLIESTKDLPLHIL